MDDAALLRRYVNVRSEEAFAEIVRRHLNLVYFAALRQLDGDVHRAKDVSQAVFARLAQKAPSLMRRESIAGWLYLTARFEARHAVRSERRRRARELEAQIMQDSDANDHAAADADRLRPFLDDALCALNERDRELVLLRFFQGCPFAELGTRFGLTTDAARFRVDRALEKIRRQLARHDVNSTATALALVLASQSHAAMPPGLATAIASSTFMPAFGKAGYASATFFELMTTTKTLVSLTVAAGLVGIGLSIHQYQHVRRVEDAIASATARHERLVAQRAQLETQARAEEARLVALEQAARNSESDQVQRKTAVSSTPARAASAPATAVPARPPINRELSENPAVREYLADWIKGNFSVSYAALYKTLGLSPEKAEALENLMVQGDINMGVWLSLRPESVPMTEITRQIRELLGPADYQKYQEYNRTAFVRRVADGLAGNLYHTDSPLTAQQANQLTQSLAESSPQFRERKQPFPSMVDWPTAVEKAEGFLSAPQLAVLKRQAQVLGAQSDLWSGLNPIYPGMAGISVAPPASVFAPPAPAP